MKITIEPTEPVETRHQRSAEAQHFAVSVETDQYDDVDAVVFFRALRQAAIAWGFPESVVNDFMPPE